MLLGNVPRIQKIFSLSLLLNLIITSDYKLYDSNSDIKNTKSAFTVLKFNNIAINTIIGLNKTISIYRAFTIFSYSMHMLKKYESKFKKRMHQI
jgi:hypothetical protein